MRLRFRYHSLLEALNYDGSRQPGEAWVWRIRPFIRSCSRSQSVVVDIGQTLRTGELAATAHPEILILTHDDHDHIGGWKGFSRDGLGWLKQLWIPYEWGALYHLVQEFDPEADVDPEDRSSTPPWPLDASTDPDCGREFSCRGEVLDVESALGKIKSSTEKFREELEPLLAEIMEQDGEAEPIGTPKDVVKRAVERAERILSIISGALAAGVRVRYFSVDHKASSPAPWMREGEPGLATIANAVEVGRPRALGRDVFAFARLMHLTIQNKRALCPVLWDGHGPEVLVWSDNTGAWASTPRYRACELLRRVSVCTAPHHGSGNSEHGPAWRAMDHHFDVGRGIVVLAGGFKGQGEPHPDFLAIAADHRACTTHRGHKGRHRDSGRVRVLFEDGCAPAIVAGECGS